MRKYSYLLSVLFVGIGAVITSAPSQAQNAKHDYLQAWTLASSAINSCYTNKDLQECDKLTQIKNTLVSWCQETNNIKSDACVFYQNVVGYEGVIQQAQIINEIK